MKGKPRYFLSFNQAKLQAMAAKFYICMLLVVLVSSAVHSARLRRPQEKEKTYNFLYERIFDVPTDGASESFL